jgi:DNA-binding transcriptional ArsR family regulator
LMRVVVDRIWVDECGAVVVSLLDKRVSRCFIIKDDMNNVVNGRGVPDVCEIQCVNEANVRAALEALPDDNVVLALAETFKTLADPTRLRIIAALGAKELCVCDLAQMLGITGSAVSHQLRLMRGQKLVRYRKEGKIAHYSLDDSHIEALLAQAVEHVEEG